MLPIYLHSVYKLGQIKDIQPIKNAIAPHLWQKRHKSHDLWTITIKPAVKTDFEYLIGNELLDIAQRLWLFVCRWVNLADRTTVFGKLFHILEWFECDIELFLVQNQGD